MLSPPKSADEKLPPRAEEKDDGAPPSASTRRASRGWRPAEYDVEAPGAAAVRPSAVYSLAMMPPRSISMGGRAIPRPRTCPRPPLLLRCRRCPSAEGRRRCWWTVAFQERL